jgi:transcription antitermination factor NusG
MRQWFALCTLSRHEHAVYERLLHLQFEAFLPLYRADRQWKKARPVSLDLPLFPGYLFVRIAHASRGKVLGIPGVLSLVGSRREAWPLDDSVIDCLRSGLHLRKVQPYPHFVVGERVRIAKGALQGLEGLLVRKKNNLRVVVSLDLVPTSILVEVAEHEIECVSTDTPKGLPAR